MSSERNIKKIVAVSQYPESDIIEISAESPSPREAALIANTYAAKYKTINLEINRSELTAVKDFLEKQAKEKQEELNKTEDELNTFKEKGGIVQLDDQSKELISQLAGLDAERDAAKIDLLSSNEMLKQYKEQMKAQDPKLAAYLESQTSQAYIDVLQKQIADLQMNKDLAMASNNSNIDISAKIKSFDLKINELKQKLNEKFEEIKSSAYAGTPKQAEVLTGKLIEEEINNHSLAIRLKELQSIINRYESKMSTLPKTTTELARYERKKESLEQLYKMVDQRYQEAELNELSRPGNVVIVEKGKVPLIT